MKLKKLIFPALAFLLLSSTTFAQQTKISEVDQIGVAKKDRKDKKEAAISKPTNSDDQLMEKKVYKKEKTKRKREGSGINEHEIHKDGRYPQKPNDKSKKKIKRKGLKTQGKAQKQTFENQSENQ